MKHVVQPHPFIMTYDFAVIGGGIAGASVAAELVPHGSTVLLEAEDTPGYHSTGRSAAFWHETLGGPLVQQLSVASLDTLEHGGFLTPRTSLNVADAAHLPLLDALEARFEGAGAKLTRVDHQGILKWVPRATEGLAGGVIEDRCADIDVAGLHGACLKMFRQPGGVLESDFRVDRLRRIGSTWQISAGARTIEARTVVNAAGAWADEVGKLAGAAVLGLQPMRRTIAQVRVTTNDVPPTLPLTIDIAGTYYFRPEGPDRLWLCPHDESPVDPHDAAPEEIDVALAIDRFESVTTWRVAAVERKWAGLRTFAPDRLPVIGFDPDVPHFFWLAGQGGTGIQTAPAMARIAAAQLLRRSPHPSVEKIDARPFSPKRFALTPNPS
ncbi:MAG TPA: FAD-dependent oxidoreductase [Sphingomonas sp.]|nr:FAD-dependent oxidoreductase [Sphingomonas sp.]